MILEARKRSREHGPQASRHQKSSRVPIVALLLMMAFGTGWWVQETQSMRPHTSGVALSPPVLETISKFPEEYREGILRHFGIEQTAGITGNKKIPAQKPIEPKTTHALVVSPAVGPINLRSGPGLDYKILARADINDEFEVTKENLKWLKLRPVSRDDLPRTSWVRSDLVLEKQIQRRAAEGRN